MAAGATPHFQNEQGLAVIEIGAREFMCIGALPPFDHPHVFIDMGAESEAICPYCSTLYRHNPRLAPTGSLPPNAHWRDQAA
ncbi:zinc-finger domain-containing protein [Aestuariivirga sp.]|uniref:zinc-finger domain-containing protein n=1 Tax=Aestuariivirga sp. TaxID=2650926 RepID=UPI0025BC3877|nr:zinc-finger domain-containing protein [Aestuariivirga sp.]MCA3555127.1 zinc-finger domain-containing protein [Aestuariivirga sp.]